MGKLTATRVKALDEPGMHSDGRGLYLRIAPGGSKGWMLRLTIDGKRRDMGLGGYPAVSLARARQLAEANRAAVADGRDPLAERRREKTPTFEAAARTVHEANQPRWRNGKHNDGWIASLERHAFPVLGKMTLDRIRREDVLRVLTPIWSAKPETARRVRQRIRDCPQVGAGAWLRRAQHGRRDHRRRIAGHAEGQGAFPGAAIPRDCRCAGRHRARPGRD